MVQLGTHGFGGHGEPGFLRQLGQSSLGLSFPHLEIGADIDCTRSCKVSNVCRRLAFESLIFVLTCAVQTRGSLDLRGKVAANCAKQASQQFSCGPRTSNFTPWDQGKAR